MDLKTSVLIVSAHGRGHWLAAELHREHIPVTVIDVSSKLGVWPPEDLEGPFGFLKSEELTPSQSERVFAEDAYISVDEGFTTWLPDGPLERPAEPRRSDPSDLVCKAQSGFSFRPGHRATTS
ncbi:MAG: hypothetical protein EOP06_19855 [Proteobacteria bacterium]|nr:MAG: hypothetical protein EOP06_19855 [Pseudomonadota bacterium]